LAVEFPDETTEGRNHALARHFLRDLLASTPDRVWQALTGAEALQQNWGLIHSKWTPGARAEEVSDSENCLWQGEVLEADPGRHLSFTFDVVGSGEKPPSVSFDIAAPASAVRPLEAWTEIMSSIKSYVETGKPLPFAWKH
jgi:uncharacterized protein YndB with AHSA1/START domain